MQQFRPALSFWVFLCCALSKKKKNGPKSQVVDIQSFAPV
jgi:hypothetical protein